MLHRQQKRDPDAENVGAKRKNKPANSSGKGALRKAANQLSPNAIARAYIERGWCPVPLAYGTKLATDDKWQELAIDRENVDLHFNGKAQNVAVQLGPRSHDLADVDLDCDEAVKLARAFLPNTGAIFGRMSKPAAHYLFYVHDPEPKATVTRRTR